MRINTDNITNHPKIRAINANIERYPPNHDTDDKLENICVTTPEIILAKMIREVPFVIPFSVIQSAKNNIIRDPTAKIKAEKSTTDQDDVSIRPPIRELMKKTIPIDCTNAKGNVIYLI